MVNDFLFELGCEELPSGSVWPLADELASLIITGLDKAKLAYGEVKRFATPRRIAVAVYDLQTEQPSQSITRKGPAAIAAFDNEGAPTQALLGFAKSCGVDVSALTRLETDKGDWMVFETKTTGNLTKNVLPGILTQSLANLPVSKPMRWGNGDDEFVRPVHWAVLLYGDEIIEHEVFGIKTNRYSRGHRFHHPQEIGISSAREYEKQLHDAFVVADFASRRHLIKEQVQHLVTPYQATALMHNELVDEVTSIVEWPQAMLAHFDEDFLQVPAEALIASMQSHQKCFALIDKQGKLLPHFITVANIASANPQQVIMGNEKVMRARLSDAAFFYNQDKKSPLSQHIDATKNVIFQIKLGTLHDKSTRVAALMLYLCDLMNIPRPLGERAALLSKCDLMTGMVGEFPELQGLMGYYYALHDGEDKSVALALNEQYMPRFAADNLPSSDLGVALSLAERIDTLVGIFAIGQKPSGVKDPFKLRRHALAVARLLISIPSSLTLSDLIEQSANWYSDVNSFDKSLLVELKPFILERLNAYYQTQGLSQDIVQAVRARQDEWLYDLDKRVNALKHFVLLSEAASLCAACKRVNNILAQTGELQRDKIVDERLLEEGAERSLYTHIKEVSSLVAPLYQQAQYDVLLQHLAGLKEPIDAFFDKVMVMVDDSAVKNNRIILLASLQSLLQGVADISMLQLT